VTGSYTLQASTYRVQVGARTWDCHLLALGPCALPSAKWPFRRITLALSGTVHQLSKEVVNSRRFAERLCPNCVTSLRFAETKEFGPHPSYPNIIQSTEILSIDSPDLLIKQTPPRMTGTAPNDEIHDDGAPSPGIKRVVTGQQLPQYLRIDIDEMQTREIKRSDSYEWTRCNYFALLKERVLTRYNSYSRKDRQVHFVKTAKITPRPDRFGKTALVVRRIITSKGMVADTEIDIKSPHLDRLLKEIFEGVPDLKLNESPPIVSLNEELLHSSHLQAGRPRQNFFSMRHPNCWRSRRRKSKKHSLSNRSSTTLARFCALSRRTLVGLSTVFNPSSLKGRSHSTFSGRSSRRANSLLRWSTGF
jgi:hypothetical protein